MSRGLLNLSFGVAAALAIAVPMSWAQSDNSLVEANGLGDPWREVPVTHVLPGGGIVPPDIKNPMAGDSGSAERGMQYFANFNCIGCHAPNGGGGMGPSLSNSQWIYGSTPANIYLTIVQGRPNGMPAFGSMLPDQIIWDLVSYVQGISEKPGKTYGTTTSANAPKIEQVPAEALETTKPWDHTEPFSKGQPPGSAGSQ
jgi:cytochrome c oxidase cbb3-type subunit III